MTESKHMLIWRDCSNQNIIVVLYRVTLLKRQKGLSNEEQLWFYLKRFHLAFLSDFISERIV